MPFPEENDVPVVGLREGGMVTNEQHSTILKGVAGARIFRRGFEPVEIEPGPHSVEPLPNKSQYPQPTT